MREDSLEGNRKKNPIRVLIVDDEIENVRPLCKRLHSRGFNVVPATSGRMALNEMRKIHIDVAIVNFHMPDTNGEEFFEAIRIKQPDISVIMVTGNGKLTHASKLGKKGVYNYLAKPVDIETLITSVENVYRERSNSRDVR